MNLILGHLKKSKMNLILDHFLTFGAGDTYIKTFKLTNAYKWIVHFEDPNDLSYRHNSDTILLWTLWIVELYLMFINELV